MLEPDPVESDPDSGERRESTRENAGPARSGLTPIAVGNAANDLDVDDDPREALRALIRERNYLREVRDLQLAEHRAEVAELRAHANELQRQLDAARAERDARRQHNEVLEEQVDAQRQQALHFLGLLTQQRHRTAELLQELAAQRGRTAS